MTTPVGTARFEITGDVEAFAAKTEAEMQATMSELLTVIEEGNVKLSELMAEGGAEAGTALAAGVKETAGPGVEAATAEAAAKGKVAAEAGGAESGVAYGEKFAESAKETTRALSGTILAGIGALGVAEVVKSSIEAADSLEANTEKIDGVFGESAENVAKWASGVAGSLRLSTSAAEAQAGTFGQFLHGFGIGQEQASGMSEQLVSLAQNVAKFNNADPAAVSAAIQSGLKGRANALKQYGITLDAATINQEALAHSSELGTIAMSNGQPVLTTAQKGIASYYALLDQTKNQQGALAESSGTLAAKQKITAAEFTNAEAALGKELLPVLAKVAGYVADTVIPDLVLLGGWIQKNRGWIVPLVAVLAGAAAAFKIASIAVAIFNAVVAANPIVLIIAALAALVIGVIYAYTHFQIFRTVVQDIWNFLKTWGTTILLVIAPFLAIPIIIYQHWSQIVSFLQLAWNDVVNFIMQWGPLVLTVLAPFLGIPLLIWQHWSQITGFISSIFSSALSTVEGYVSSIVGVVMGLPGKIEGLVGDMSAAGGKLIGALWSGISSAAGAALDLGSKLKSAVNSALGLPHSFGPWHVGVGPVSVTLPGFSIGGLATGGMTNGPALAVVGDNPGGRELVMPMNSPRTTALLSDAMMKANANGPATQGGGGGVMMSDAQFQAMMDALSAPVRLMSVNGQQFAQIVNTANERNGRRR